jgi:hypothetical protein
VPLFAADRDDFFKTLAPDSVVVIGKNAPAEELAAAKKLAAAFQKFGADKENLVTDEKIADDLELAASKHLFLIGTPATNEVMSRLRSHWALDRDDYYKTAPKPPHDFMPVTGYYAAGYVELPSGGADCGYAEWDRNHYWHYVLNLFLGSNNDKLKEAAPKIPYRQIIRLTGNTPRGVASAVDAFLNDGLLTGVVTAPANFGAATMFAVSAPEAALGDALAPRGKIVAPEKTADGAEKFVIFTGFHQGDAMVYSGVEQICGVRPRHLARAKYLTEEGWSTSPYLVKDPSHPMTRSPLFEATLARRASGNELLIIQFANAAEAKTAAEKFEATLTARRDHSHAPWTDVKIGANNWRLSRFGLHLGVVGDKVVMESFAAPYDAAVLREVRIKN